MAVIVIGLLVPIWGLISWLIAAQNFESALDAAIEQKTRLAQLLSGSL